ncbi:MAG TPA: SLBB domain-containing protein [Candidatus Acidoferrales bacterium]|nr:SLBB domain-containing protein [Candidatus Acidoferrales bacterium]
MNCAKTVKNASAPRIPWGTARGVICALVALGLGCSAIRAQNQRPTSTIGSDLGRDNLSRVAASAAELKAVLLTEVGLMVELKRWVAKDATDHGQIISDSDLTNDAIFERLETDVRFRSIATTIVQKYGFLVPRVNPESELGREQALLVEERTKWMAQHQEEERAAAHQKTLQKNLQTASACDPQSDLDCTNAQQNAPADNDGSQGRQGPALQSPQLRSPDQYQSVPPNFPSGGENPLERGLLMQANGDPLNNNQSDQLGDRSDGMQLFGGMGSNQSGSGTGSGSSSGSSLGQLLAGGDNQQSSSGFGGGGGSLPNMSGGDMGAGGMGMDSASAALAMASLGSSGRDMNGPPSSGMSPVVPVRPSSRRSQQNALIEPAEMARKQSPYTDIPSLYDMYLQAVPRPATPRRFGSEVFENGTRDPQYIPMDLPVGPDYVVGPGDGLSIDLWGGVSQRFFRTVDREGRVSLPEAGPVLVSGRNLADVQQDLQRILRTEFRDVSAEVSLARLRTIRIYEVGDVANPGAYDISSLSTPLNALFAAGGPTPKGSLRIVKHYRGNQLVQVVDLYDLLLHGVKSDMARLDNGDTVLVPPIGPQVTVEGMVRRPAIYELKDEKNLAAVLELSGGLLPAAALRHIEVQRLVAHDKQTMLSLDIPEIGDSAEVTKKLEAFQIQDGDRIRIFPIASYNQDAIYLDGHVIRPGRYSYRENMRVTDVIASYKDLLPEPAANYAEIIRLNPPDFHPTVESFDLADTFANPAQAPVLHPMDTVRIFSRFDFENPPVVSVWGDVRAPGTYRTSGQIRLGDAIHLAGGLAPDAQKEDAQVFRYLPDGKFKIFSVNLSEALSGDPTENIVLQPRDRLLIHRNPDAVEPATVYIQGEVARPGRYPLTTNMTVAELIQVGGGLKPSADTNTADLTHFQYANQSSLTAQHESISLSSALSKGPEAAITIHNGDVLTVRQLPGWNDLGASITVKGEVRNPGTYGIRPGEKLSSILERAGGFQPDSYPYGAVLRRVQVRELEVRDQDQMILRVKDEQSNLQLLPETDPDKKRAKDLALQQWQTALEQLSSNPPTGRVAIRISADIHQWQNTIADVDVRAGDSIEIPKKPSYVMVTGQVYNPTAVSYRPGKSASWYLGQSGGPTQLANKKAIFVIRADGSVLGSSQGLWSGESLGAELRPGDTVVVPEKAVGGGVQWQTVFLAAQVASSIASTAFIAAHY